MLKIAVHACIYVHYNGQVTNSDLLTVHEGVDVSVISCRQGAASMYLERYMLPRAQDRGPCSHIYLLQGTGDRFQLAKPCVKVLTSPWLCVGRKLPRRISTNTSSPMLELVVHCRVYYKPQVTDFDLLHTV